MCIIEVPDSAEMSTLWATPGNAVARTARRRHSSFTLGTCQQIGMEAVDSMVILYGWARSLGGPRVIVRAST